MNINIKNLTKKYRTKEGTIDAFKNVTVDIKSGEFITIMGKSGSGKTSLLHIIGLLDYPTIGEITMDGNIISNANESTLVNIREQKIGFIFQNYHLLPNMTALENVLLPLHLKTDLSHDEKLIMAKEALREVSLYDRVDHLPKQLSGGEQQRVAIARGLVKNPSLIIADEPTGNLDEETEIEILNLLKKLHKDNRTLIIATHNNLVRNFAERNLIMNNGSLEESNI
ncbi:hypothetical protein BEH_26405 (plasmid) [Priestia filamentosa]|uniref:ABC transporter domain-containing protein n=1 Tax=Priestia filamentosa TaxID=1402861 RepID=A0A2S1LZS8_9BACI|nr:ABC transporter ATP-binding protein [Priestia filamentosa]AWG44320.1 hypothetical protein BEH_26405 [Priestia filamentosa]